MRILHLAYEDPRQPGSGGGSVRTREINRRLAREHEITCVVTSYPGAEPRVEDGVQWVPVGTSSGTKLDRLIYFSLIAREVHRWPHDLVVEDFGAPFSAGFSPRFTRKPVVASVQWLFAEEMARKYHLPFDFVERNGLRLYHDFIVVSDWLGNIVRSRQPGALVETIPNGVEDLAFASREARPEHLLFVGRLDAEQKGIDLLPAILAHARALLGSTTPRLVVVGDGPDKQSFVAAAAQAGVLDLIEMRGRVEGEEKYRLMAGAHAVLMPSRFETFGMVAAESQAAMAPVVAFDVGPLREVAGPGGARLVRSFEVGDFAVEVATLVQDSRLADEIRKKGREWARRYNWDSIARKQEAHYLRTLAGDSTHERAA